MSASWSAGHWHVSHDFLAAEWAFWRDLRAALALHEDVMGHGWEKVAGQEWDAARCGRCGMSLVAAYRHARDAGRPR